jgi:hypothetical protein
MNNVQVSKLHPDWTFEMSLIPRVEREKGMLLKAEFIRDQVKHYGKVLFMDGDAILMKPLDVKFDTQDAIVTVRKSNHGRINSGVVWIQNLDMANEWVELTKNNLNSGHTDYSEQNALLTLVDSGRYKVDELLCSQYNYTTVEKGIPDNVKIVHLKFERMMKTEMVRIVCDHL